MRPNGIITFTTDFGLTDSYVGSMKGVILVIVDPGVGSQRRAVALETPEAIFIAPGNDILTEVWHDARARWGPEGCRKGARHILA